MSLFAGELQFAFVCFLVGSVYEAFEHWKSLLALLCRSEEAMKERKDLYLGLIAVLYHQLGEIPPDFFVDIVSQNNFLTTTLQVRFTQLPNVKSSYSQHQIKKVLFTLGIFLMSIIHQAAIFQSINRICFSDFIFHQNIIILWLMSKTHKLLVNINSQIDVYAWPFLNSNNRADKM